VYIGRWLQRRSRSRKEDNIKCILRKQAGRGMHWIHLAQYKDQWPTLLNRKGTWQFHKMLKYVVLPSNCYILENISAPWSQ
jgi:hypothetical protein